MKNLSLKHAVLVWGMTLSSLVGMAQLTLTHNDMMIVGTQIDLFYDTTGPVLDLGMAGSGQLWDFASVTPSMQFNSDIVSPVGTIGEHEFPTANAVIHRIGINTQYYENTPTELIYLGAVVTVLDTFFYHYNYNTLTYPVSMGTSFSDVGDRNLVYSYPLGIDPDQAGPHPMVDSLAVFAVTVREATIDAEGKVKTPEGEFEALRQNATYIDIDSAFMYAGGKWEPLSTLLSNMMMVPQAEIDTTYAYHWLAAGKSLPVIGVEYDPSNNDVIVAQWITVGPVGIDEQEVASSIEIFPNPARDEIQVNTQLSGGKVGLYDMNGRLSKLIQLESGQATVPVHDLSSGPYVMTVFEASGQPLLRRTVQVVE